ncbi:MAG: hypothetical protein R2849_15195 [Thermomicrobiales bacterium]
MLSRERSYHGNTLGALSISGFDQPGAVRAVAAECAESARVQPSLSGQPGRSPEELGQPVLRERSGAGDSGRRPASGFGIHRRTDRRAAGAATTPPPGYFERIREICDAYDILFSIADEVGSPDSADRDELGSTTGASCRTSS